MITSNRPPTAPQTQRRISVNPFAAVLQDDDDDATPKPMETLNPPRFNNSNKSVEDQKDDDDDDDECSQTSQSSSNQRVRPPRPSMAVLASKISQQQLRRRRRSSARFLQLSRATRDSTNIGEEDDDEDDDDEMGHRSSTMSQKGTLQEMYQTAIRMNAENKINTTNSWNLHIIDQMDTLLSLNDGIESTGKLNSKVSNQTMDGVDETTSTRVNFTKASCTLDASVKIYSYRVDDVHLTSYKVLANLNRTQNNKNDKATTHPTDDNPNNNGDDEEATNDKSQRKEANKASSGSTLETNIANINLNRLDSAYDIDPLFHKMSKTFDEGGAKGLLLANLGVSESSCRIIFDSSANDAEGVERNVTTNPPPNLEQNNPQEQSYRIAEGMMDITSLTEKLKSLLSDYCDDDEWDIENCNSNICSVRSIPLVPQLSSLRTEHEKLVELGCCGPDAATALASTIGPKTPAGKVRKYHANSEQEQDADYSIHKEAIERSHRKLNFTGDDVNITPRNSLFPNDGTDHHSKAFTPSNDTPMGDDYGGGYGYDDGVDDDDDHCFDAFIANARYSDVSLASATGQLGIVATSSDNTIMQQQPSTYVANFIDAISSGTTVLSNSDYEYFSTKNSKSNNEWAGAAHWKRDNGAKSNDMKTKKKASKKKSSKRKKLVVNGETLVTFDPSLPPDLSDFLRAATKRRGNSTSSSSSTLLTKAMIAKYTDEENILPHDAGFQSDSRHKNSLYQLTKLFLCPHVSILQPLNQNTMNSGNDDIASSIEPKKTVEFNLPASTDWDDDNDDGPAYDFGGGDQNDDDDDEFVVPLLENIRKVDKVRVGYATIAKKVDVKRLKRDLWSELESRFNPTAIDNNITNTSENEMSLSPSASKVDIVTTPIEASAVSFQETVRILGQEQSQTDITLPFYFICILHLANEKGLRLEQHGIGDDKNTEAQQRLLSDFAIYRDELLTNDIY